MVEMANQLKKIDEDFSSDVILDTSKPCTCDLILYSRSNYVPNANIFKLLVEIQMASAPKFPLASEGWHCRWKR